MRYLLFLVGLMLAMHAPVADARTPRMGASFGDDSAGDDTIGTGVECIDVGANTSVDSTAISVPHETPVRFTKATIQFSATTGLSGTPQLTHWWAVASDGDDGITPKATSDLNIGATTATDAWVTEIFDDFPPHVPDDRSTAGTVYLCMSLDQGSATLDFVKLEHWRL